jgi:hypothetical protein
MRRSVIAFLLLCSLAQADVIDCIRAGVPQVVVPLGEYVLTEPLSIPSGMTILCAEGTTFVAAEGAFKGTHDCLIDMIGTANTTIIGCAFKMRRDDYGVYAFPKPDYEPSESRHAINILGAKNIRLTNIRADFSGGDGIFIGSTGPSSARVPSENIFIKDSVTDSNLRQGISIVSAKGVLIEDCVFSNTKGSSPQAGIDIEPEYRDFVEIVVRRCQSNGNRGPGYMVGLFKVNPDDKPCRIVFESCRYKDVPDDQVNLRLGGVLNHEVPNGYLRPNLPLGTHIQWNDLVFDN